MQATGYDSSAAVRAAARPRPAGRYTLPLHLPLGTFMLSSATATSFTFFAALSVLLRVAAAPTCDSRASGRCDVCDACCKGWLAGGPNATYYCGACVAAECGGRKPDLCGQRAPPSSAC